MPSHYSTIGLALSTPEDLLNFAERLRPATVPIATRIGTYLRWSSTEGAELWLQIDRRGEIIGAHPHFSGESRTPMLIESVIHRDDQTDMDGAYSGWANPSEDESVGLYPLIIDCANYREVSATALPAIGTVQIAAFAYEAAAFNSVEEFDASQSEEIKLASQAFVPAAALDDGRGRAEALIIGHVLASGSQRNELTGRTFHWAQVKSYGAMFDLVADPEVLPNVPALGGVVKGTFWLSARVLRLQSRAGTMKKVLWRLRNAG
jgi:hypothetical protein